MERAADVAVEAAESAKAGTFWKMHEHRLKSRHRKIFGDLAKVEHSGPDGGPIRTQQVEVTDQERDEAFARLVAQRGYVKGGQDE